MRNDRKERRKRGREFIDNMLAARTEMLVLFCKVSGTDPYGNNNSDEVDAELLQNFCQILVDYIASAHFSLYERILQGRERRQPVYRLAEQIYPRIAESTEMAVDFSEKYEVMDGGLLHQSLQEDLSELGEQLASRIELEDRLITALIGQPVEIAAPRLV